LRSFQPWLRASAMVNISETHPSVSLISPTESDQNRPSPAAAVDSSHGVWSLAATSAPGARLPRACLTRHLPTSGFLTLLPAYFSQNLPALFHAVAARRVLLQGLSPRWSLRFLSKPVPFMTLVRAQARFGGTPKHPARHLAFKVLLSVRIRHLRSRCEPNSWRPLPSWFSNL